MGSITSINRNPKSWSVLDRGETLKTTDEPVVKVQYGACDDYPGMYELSMYMRKSVYGKCISGEYAVSPESGLVTGLVLVDRTGNPVPPVKTGVVY